MKETIVKIKQCFSIETCYAGDREKWSEENPTTGHCAVSALLLQNLFGGIICKTTVNRHSHYFNKFDDVIVDITAEQFGDIHINYDKCFICNVENMLKNKDTKSRYEKLREKFLLI